MANIPRKLNAKENLKASWLNQMRDYVASITPRGDSKTTAVNVTPGGSTIRALSKKGGVSANDKYEGYFKVTNSSTEVQRLNIATGVCLINDTWFTVATDDIPITSSGYIYLESEYTPAVEDDAGNIMTNGVVNTPVFLFSAGIPTYSDTHFRVIITDVTFASDVITGFIQQNHGQIAGYIMDKLAKDVLDNAEMNDKLAEIFCNTYNSGCTDGKCTSKGNKVTKSGTKSEVDTEIAKYDQDGVDIACKSKESGTYNGGQCGSGKIYDAKPLDTEDGTAFTQTVYYCCCEDAPDEEEECVTCSEQNATCNDPAHPDCEARGTATQSAVYVSYSDCSRNRNYATSASALDKACRDIDTGDPNTGYYYCCHTSSADCTGSGESWTYTRSLCCCVADCSSAGGTDLRTVLSGSVTSPIGGWFSDTNGRPVDSNSSAWKTTPVGTWTNYYPCARNVRQTSTPAHGAYSSTMYFNGDRYAGTHSEWRTVSSGVTVTLCAIQFTGDPDVEASPGIPPGISWTCKLEEMKET